VPGVSGFILHTSKGSIAYIADIRFHGRRKQDSEQFVEKCASSDIDLLLCEGTRVHESFSTEFEVEDDVKGIVGRTEKLVVCSYLLETWTGYSRSITPPKSAAVTL
jgi:ribonuclease J